MATKPRRFNPSFYYHIYNRGVDGRNLFNSVRDYQRFLDTVGFYLHNQTISYAQFQELNVQARTAYIQLNPKGLRTLRVRMLAYCVMPNHFHLLIKPTESANLTQFVSDVTNSYTKYFNIKNGRVGRFVQGTFKSKEIADEPSLLQVSRYIHLNPILSPKTNPKSRLKKPDDYPYSSYAAWVGKSQDSLVDHEELKLWLKSSGGAEKYSRFVEAKINNNPALGIENLVLEN